MKFDLKKTNCFGTDGYGVFIDMYSPNDEVEVYDTRGQKEGTARKSTCQLRFSIKDGAPYFIHCGQRYYLREMMPC